MLELGFGDLRFQIGDFGVGFREPLREVIPLFGDLVQIVRDFAELVLQFLNFTTSKHSYLLMKCAGK